jgi:hypothetical protein
VLSGIVIGLLALLNAALAYVGCVWFFAVILFVIVGFIAMLAPFFGAGWAAARVTTYFGQVGKNRNELVASLVSMAAAASSVAIVWLVFVLVGMTQLDAMNPFDLGGSWLHWLVHGFAILGAIIAVLTAWAMASTYVQEAKFCEECEEFMTETELKSLGIGGIKAMVEAIQEKKLPIAASFLTCKKGEDGKVMLYACPCCDAGYVEVTVDFKAHWDENAPRQDQTESWRVASKPLDEYEVEWFRIFKEIAEDEDDEDEGVED